MSLFKGWKAIGCCGARCGSPRVEVGRLFEGVPREEVNLSRERQKLESGVASDYKDLIICV